MNVEPGGDLPRRQGGPTPGLPQDAGGGAGPSGASGARDRQSLLAGPWFVVVGLLILVSGVRSLGDSDSDPFLSHLLLGGGVVSIGQGAFVLLRYMRARRVRAGA